MRTLGLNGAVSGPEIKRQYRRLAQLYHPDKHGGSDESRLRFSEIATAYRLLMRALRSVEQGRSVGTCWSCRQFGEVTRGPDGHTRCPECALHGPRKLLPLPTIVVVRCVGTIAMLALSAALLITADGDPAWLGGAMAAGLGALILLAATCVSVVHCADARTLRRERAGGETRETG